MESPSAVRRRASIYCRGALSNKKVDAVAAAQQIYSDI